MNISYYNGVNDLIIHSIFFTFVYINMKSIDIHINSNDRTSGTNENFSTNLFLPINNIKNIKIKSIEIPLTYYIVNSSNNTINFTLGGSNNAILIPGNYTASQLTD